MQATTAKRRNRQRVVQREAAERYLRITLLSFAATVGLTRLYLSATNYPTIGSGDIHIAHVLWGGLLLYAAALLPLLFANRRILTISALLTGAGMGEFIDEVGKFITTKNDYFYPPAAAIVYALFLLTIVLFLRVQRVSRARARDELTHVFEDLWEAMDGGITPREQERLNRRLGIAAEAAPSERHAELAHTLRAFVESEAKRPDAPADAPERAPNRLLQAVNRMFAPRYLRALLIAGLFGIGLLTLKNPVTVWFGEWLPGGFADFLSALHMGRQVEASAAPWWFSMRLTLEVAVGVLLLISAGLLTSKKRVRQGTAAGSLSLILSLTTISVLLFYFEQFSTIITTGIQFLLLIGLAAYRERLK
jgi:hypothetical protein